MAFHVEIRRGFRVARAFNLTRQKLHDNVLLPWSHGAEVSLGERWWDPAASQLTVLEGPELDASRLAVGQGWTNAERSGREVTAELLAQVTGSATVPAGTVAVLAQSDTAARAARATVADLGLRALAWSSVRAEALASDAAAPPVLIALDLDAAPHDGASAGWWLEAGIVFGALRERAIVVASGTGTLPDALDGVEAIRLEPAEPAARALAGRLRRVGVAVP